MIVILLNPDSKYVEGSLPQNERTNLRVWDGGQLIVTERCLPKLEVTSVSIRLNQYADLENAPLSIHPDLDASG